MSKYFLSSFVFIFSIATAAQSRITEEMLEPLPSMSRQRESSDVSAEVPQTERSVPSELVREDMQPHPKIKKRAVANDSPRAKSQVGNMPSYAIRSLPVDQFQVPTVTPKNTDFDNLIGLRRGDILKAVINQNIVAYTGSKAPVSARVLEGKYKGASLQGEATMDPITKRANIQFDSIRPLKSKDTYTITGDLMAEDGIRGLQGEYESSYWTYFWAETITNTVAGFAKASTTQNPTVWGTYVPEPGIKNQTTQAVADGLANTAQRLGERSKTAPEITTVYGPVIVQITITK